LDCKEQRMSSLRTLYPYQCVSGTESLLLLLLLVVVVVV
jgi:hypothetical protein